ncbi:MAG: tetratricopeptide repeat protein [Gemmataceae bacterium]
MKAYRNRGFAYSSLKNYREAIADYTKVIEFDPNDVVTYTNRGDAYKAIGKTIEVEANFAKANALQK